MNAKRLTRYVAAVGLFALLTFIIWSATSEPEAPKAPAGDRQEAPFGVLDDCVLTRTVGGARQAQLTAKTGFFYQDRQEVELRQVEAVFHDRDRDLSVRGEQGRFSLVTRQGELAGSVIGRTSDGMTLRTTRLGFDAEKKQLHTEDAVLIDGPNFTLRGVGADADLTLAKAQLHHQIVATAWGGARP